MSVLWNKRYDRSSLFCLMFTFNILPLYPVLHEASSKQTSWIDFPMVTLGEKIYNVFSLTCSSPGGQ